MAVRRRVGGSVSRHRPGQGPTAGAWMALGGVVFVTVIGVFVFLGRNRGTSSSESEPPGDSSSGSYVPRDVEQIADLPREGEQETESKTETEPGSRPETAAAARGEESLLATRAKPDAALPPGTYDPFVDPLSRPASADPAGMLGFDVGSSRGSADLPSAPATPRASGPAGGGSLFTLALGGKIGRSQLDPQDAQTWGKIGYFLQQTPSFALVYPNGFVPLIQKARTDGKVEVESGKTPTSGAAGDTAHPGYRLVIQASAGSAGKITVYGTVMGSKYYSKLTCRLEAVVDGKVNVLRNFSVSEKVTSAKAHPDYNELSRLAYDKAVDTLVRKLATFPMFRRGN